MIMKPEEIEMRSVYLSDKLLKWHRKENPRILPWKESNEPYKIWISEIMSHQTRLEYAIPYYEKFVKAFPTVKVMAASDEDTILSMWSGLGYYSRARNMYKTACIIAEQYNGIFPDNYTEILALPGIGEYTAAAICSFAYGQKYPVVDANVERIYARYNTVADDLKKKKGKTEMLGFMNLAIENVDPADFNQAIMDFGAFVCKPVNPACEICPLNSNCIAYNSGTVNLFPPKIKKIVRRQRYFHYLILKRGEVLYLRKRKENDIWRNLWEFPQVEGEEDKVTIELLKEYAPHQNDGSMLKEPSELYAQTLSHQEIKARFYILEILEEPANNELRGVPIDQLSEIGFPGIIRQFLQKNYGISFYGPE